MIPTNDVDRWTVSGMAQSTWTSLEISKLVVGALTPIAVAGIGWWLTRVGRRIEEAQWATRNVVGRRVELHREMAPRLNDLFCYFAWVGHFRELDPPQIVDIKRALDRIYYTNEHLFSAEFRAAYQSFMDARFRHWQAPGADAKQITSRKRLGVERGAAPWTSAWDSLFVPEPGNLAEVVARQRDTYEHVMTAFARDLGVPSAARPVTHS